MSVSIVTWLANPVDFAQGVALYAEAGGAGVYGQLFALGETSYSRQVLEQQLRKLVGPVEEMPNLSQDYLKQMRAEISQQDWQRAILNEPPPAPEPEALADVRARLKATRDERSQLHAQLTTPRLSRVIRNTMAHRIVALTDQVRELLATEAHLLEHGRLPGPLATDELVDAGELRRRLSNAISRRAKLRKRLDRASELPALEEEISLIREKLTPTQRV
ncbi:hypothetical protein CDA63_11775 [Hymenobacter amundsenii]|uniref:Uncharacterized protein n=1 Tax=Hymenobacter amundsenii TaxID=2006685 RepID=A0A246FK05_9BACT|nr:hypothetical protein [Hymenobacter amundsenii]OWP62890.1 hypothetical protein CDA63_11775 [Hymenobacter amundsenii]